MFKQFEETLERFANSLSSIASTLGVIADVLVSQGSIPEAPTGGPCSEELQEEIPASAPLDPLANAGAKTELEVLKEQADSMGIKYRSNVRSATLKKKISEAGAETHESPQPAPQETDIFGEPVSAAPFEGCKTEDDFREIAKKLIDNHTDQNEGVATVKGILSTACAVDSIPKLKEKCGGDESALGREFYKLVEACQRRLAEMGGA